jgi:glycolate dehydrogenase FAD-binding subunit
VVSARVSAAKAGKALAAACDNVRPGAADDAVGAVVPSFVAAPSSTAQASALLRACAQHDLAVLPRGSGSRLGWGVPPARCDVVVDMLRMGAVIEHAAGDLVARVQAGARMADVAAALATAGQEIALDVPGPATIGGVLADALAGPRRLRYGTPRDLLIGITVVRADGTVAHSGGKVVKNVAGYDIGKLFTGSAGTLGLITEATFRLHPLPAARAWVTARVEGAAAELAGGAAGEAATEVVAAEVVAAAANSPLVASAVELDRPAPGGPISVGVLLEGSADGVAARVREMEGLLGSLAQVPVSVAAPPDWWGGLPTVEGGAAEHTLMRVSFWVSRLGGVLDAIDAAARETGLRPAVGGSAGAGLLYVTLPGGAPGEAVARFAGRVRAAIPAGRGSAAVLAAPEAVRGALAGAAGLAGTAGLAGSVPGLALMRAVKDQFDPGHRMAPGRFTWA